MTLRVLTNISKQLIRRLIDATDYDIGGIYLLIYACTCRMQLEIQRKIKIHNAACCYSSYKNGHCQYCHSL